MINHSGLDLGTKVKHLEQLAQYRENTLRKSPELRSLFIELTSRCNENCRHCGSNCGDFEEENPLTCDEIKAFLDQVKSDFDISRMRLCITGGEPLLRKDFFKIMSFSQFTISRIDKRCQFILSQNKIAVRTHYSVRKQIGIM